MTQTASESTAPVDATGQDALVGVMYAEMAWRVPPWMKAVFFWCALLGVAALVTYSVDKRLTMHRLTMDSVVQPTPQPGQPAPAFSLPNGETMAKVDLKSLAGKWVFINFWATWCPPCRDEMPSMEMLKRRFGDDLVMLAISVDEDWGEVQRFFGDTPATFQLLWDRDKAVAHSFGTQKFPESYLIDPQGRLVAKFVGPRDWYNVGTVQYFEDILSGRRDPTSG